mgnify:CR=1 FL=1|tara:strand:+ start:143 stop:364 length:222 start_codon:yes stop_codon:yes gene_type:complete
MKKYLTVESDHGLLRDINNNAIVNNNFNEYEQFLQVSKLKYNEKKEIENLKSDVNSMKSDLDEIKSLLKSIVA